MDNIFEEIIYSEAFETRSFIDDFSALQEKGAGKGFFFILSVACHLAHRNRCTRSQLVTLLHQHFPALEWPFLRTLLELSTGHDPKRHILWVDEYECVHTHT